MFIGQGPGSKEGGGQGGMRQAEQKQVLADFCNAKFNVLVATCIAEEGLDIPQVPCAACCTVWWQCCLPAVPSLPVLGGCGLTCCACIAAAACIVLY